MRWTWSKSVAAGLVVVVGWAVVQSATGGLLGRAERLEATHGVLSNDLTETGYHYFLYQAPAFSWMPGSRLRVVARDTNRAPFHVVIDVAASRATRTAELPGLTPAESGWETTFQWAPSPDGRWMVYLQASGSNVVYAARCLEDGRHYNWTNAYSGLLTPTWLSDSSGFVDWPQVTGSWVMRRFRPGESATTDWALESMPPRQVPPRGLPTGGFVVAPRGLLSTLGRKPWNTNEPTRLPGIQLFVFPAVPGSAPEQWVVPVPVPLESDYALGEMAPDGERVAWRVDRATTLPRLVGSRQWPFVALEPRRRTAVWISDLDGSHPEFLGRLPSSSTVQVLAWDSSGDFLSFVHQGAVWRVPVHRALSRGVR